MFPRFSHCAPPVLVCAFQANLRSLPFYEDGRSERPRGVSQPLEDKAKPLFFQRLFSGGATVQGATVLTFPLSGHLAGVMVKATRDAHNEVAKVETKTENPALTGLVTETEYSDYADHGEIATDVKSPGLIVRKQGGHPVLDLHVKMLDADNPYLVFPIPENLKKAAGN
jgi:hypothetical protein